VTAQLKSLRRAADKSMIMDATLAHDPGVALTRPLRDVWQWAACFSSMEVPVLGETARALEGMRAREDDVDAHMLAEAITGDPLMTLKVLAHAGQHRPARLVTETETVTATLVLMGISPFFRAFGEQPAVEDRLSRWPGAMEGLDAVIRRAHRAARFALAFAVHRMDADAPVVHQATLLHDLAEMLLWCHAPTLALEIARRQRHDPSLRSLIVQREVLNITLAELQQALLKAWHLPELFLRIGDWRHALVPQVRNVLLAVRLARHTASGWDNPALPDDVADIAELLNLRPGPTLQFLRDVDA
jgi:HD-like signal output (HDOD) protein